MIKLILIVATTITVVGIITLIPQDLCDYPEAVKPISDETHIDQEFVDSDIFESIALKIREGFSTRDEIVDYVIEMIDDDKAVNDIKARVIIETDRRLEEHIKNQACWQKVTDCDRIDAAFADLEARGIVARQNFSCCQTCGNAEIKGEIESFSKKAKPFGYVYYHIQDTENAATGGDLYLAYGSVNHSDKETVTVGDTIRNVLMQHGLSVEWSGTPNRRICIVDLDWKKRIVIE